MEYAEYANSTPDQWQDRPAQIQTGITPLTTEPSPELDLPSTELPGKIDPGVDEFKYIERPGSLNLDTSLNEDDVDTEATETEFVGVVPDEVEEAAEPVAPVEPVTPIADVLKPTVTESTVVETNEPEEVKVVEVANRSKAVILRARPVERHFLQRHAYGRTSSSPIHQASVKKVKQQGAVSLNGLRRVFTPLPSAQIVPARNIKVAVKPIPPKTAVEAKPVLRLQAIASDHSATPGLIKANLRKVDSVAGDQGDGDQSWRDSSKQINYYVPAQPISAQPQRSADATFDLDRIEQTISGFGTPQATTELQTVDR